MKAAERRLGGKAKLYTLQSTNKLVDSDLIIEFKKEKRGPEQVTPADG